MNVLIYGTKAFDTEILRDVEPEQVDRWIAAKVIRHGDVVRPMASVSRLQLNYDEIQPTEERA